MTRLVPVLLLALLLAAAAPAGEVKISSDSFVVDDAQHLATFSGSVVVSRAALTLWAGKVVVRYGDAGPTSIKTLTASGGVRIKTKEQEAHGDTATYDPATQLLRLSGHVTLTSASGSIDSSDVVIDLKAATTTFSSGKSGRVSGVFTPQ
ncbi:MAG: LptA/OstA family protein [Devosia sp.]